MLQKPDTPKHVLARRERVRRSKARRRLGLRVWSLEISDLAMEGLIQQAIHTGHLTEREALDDAAVIRELARMLEEQGRRWMR